MWWLIGSAVAFYVAATVVAQAVTRRGADGKQPREIGHSDKVQRAFAAVNGRRTVPIGLEREGPVLIRGKVAPHHEPLTAPFVPRDCVYYDSEGLSDGRSFLVTDETGTALVAFDDLAEVVFAVPRELCPTGAKPRQAADRARGVAATLPTAVLQAAILVGDEVTVAGVGRLEVAPDGESRGPRSAPMRYVVRADPDGLLGILKRERRN
ncbi:MAG TPA: hypothetical protein VKZ18_04700 [Polyangia bacterium]|nr:hypothetical protein [Polyangia bacterium]